ncbi:MAG TPA: hypothetical protein VK530_17775 [Candidatus Acidoferrum sp.]|nr:hypothetical protein [Candidatus Acidoferrum sp.]
MDARKNFAQSVVLAAPVPALSGTQLTVASEQGALFPAAPFNATLWPASTTPTAANAEIVRVTAKADDVFTITREQEGTTAIAIAIGCNIAATITKKFADDVETALAAVTPLYGAGSPEGAVTAAPGARFWQTDTKTDWVKDNGTGNTGWLEIITLGS